MLPAAVVSPVATSAGIVMMTSPSAVGVIVEVNTSVGIVAPPAGTGADAVPLVTARSVVSAKPVTASENVIVTSKVAVFVGEVVL